MFKFQPISVASICTFVPITLAVSAIVYILAGTSGSIWVGAALDTSFVLSIFLNVAGYLSALFHRSRTYFFANLALSLVIILIFLVLYLLRFPELGKDMETMALKVLHILLSSTQF